MKTTFLHLQLAKKSKTLLLILLLILSGCLSGNYGTLKRSIALTDTFEASRVLPGYNYYYAGSKTLPDAVLGLKEEYTLNESYWKEIDLTDEQLAKWTDIIGHYNHRSYPSIYFAYYMYGPEKKQIGVWYGYTDWTSIIETAPFTYSIYTPPQKSLRKKHKLKFNSGW